MFSCFIIHGTQYTIFIKNPICLTKSNHSFKQAMNKNKIKKHYLLESSSEAVIFACDFPDEFSATHVIVLSGFRKPAVFFNTTFEPIFTKKSSSGKIQL